MSTIRYLIDENTTRALADQLLRLRPDMDILLVGDELAPPRGTLAPDSLCWMEQAGYSLITRNRKSMPIHLKNHLAVGRHVPGIFTCTYNVPIGPLIETQVLIWEAADRGNFRIKLCLSRFRCVRASRPTSRATRNFINVFSDQQLDALAQEIDRQVSALDSAESLPYTHKGQTELDRYFDQLQTLEQQTGEPPAAFLRRFRQAAKQDLCVKGGMLYEQWERWKDLSSKDAAKWFGGILAGMGISSAV
jgi:hypothetical protein